MKEQRKNRSCVTAILREEILINATETDIVSEVVEAALVPHTKAK